VKYYVDGGKVGIAAHFVYELNTSGKQLRVVKFTDYAAETIRSIWTSAAELHSQWGNTEEGLQY
jgi:type I restriction enzyme R subunit